MADGSCSYVFPDDHPEESSGMRWACPHAAHPEHDRCIFHMPFDDREEHGVEPEDVRQTVLQKANTAGERAKQFVGARFQRLDLSYVVINTADNYALDFRYCHVDDQCDLSHADIVQPVTFEGCRIDGRFQAAHTQFESFCNFADATFNDHVTFDDTTFGGPALFDDARFASGDTADGRPRFAASFQGAAFQDRCSFEETYFSGRADLREAMMQHGNFHGATIDLLFLSRADINTVFFTAVRTLNSHAYVSFVNADLRNGTLNQPYYMTDGTVRYPDETVYYNLADARIGDVTLKPDEDGILFPYLHIVETDFDGFDFSNYAEYLYPDWDIHTYDGPLLQEGNINSDLTWEYTIDPETQEATYSKARKAAAASGDTKASSMFFINQMRQRRQRYRADITEAPTLTGKLRAGFNVIGNAVLGTVAGHGEKPWRVIGTSIAVILLCALLYPISGIAAQHLSTPVSYAAVDGVADLLMVLAQSLYFSITTFATLGFGDYYPGGFYTQAIAAAESITGALLIALLVFVLGRRS